MNIFLLEKYNIGVGVCNKKGFRLVVIIDGILWLMM